eukprot:PhF_6_TR8312/c0_g1_i7/m.12879
MFADYYDEVGKHFTASPAYPVHVLNFCKAVYGRNQLGSPEDLVRLATSHGVRLSEEEARNGFGVLDVDGDGSVSLNELIEFVGNDEWRPYVIHSTLGLLKSQLRQESLQALLELPFDLFESGRPYTAEAELSQNAEIYVQTPNGPQPGTGKTSINITAVPFTAKGVEHEILAQEGEIIIGDDDDDSDSGSDSGSGSDDSDNSNEQRRRAMKKASKTFLSIRMPLRSVPTDKEIGAAKKNFKKIVKTVFERPLRRGKITVAYKVDKTSPQPSLILSLRGAADPFMKDFVEMLQEVFRQTSDPNVFVEGIFEHFTATLDFEKSIGDVLRDDSGAALSILRQLSLHLSLALKTDFIASILDQVFGRIAMDESREAIKLFLSLIGYNVWRGQRLSVYLNDPVMSFFDVVRAAGDCLRHNSAFMESSDSDSVFSLTDVAEESARFSFERFFPVHMSPAIPKKFIFQALGKQRSFKQVPKLLHFLSKYVESIDQVNFCTIAYRLTANLRGFDVFNLLPKSDDDMGALYQKYCGKKWKNPFGKSKKGGDDDSDGGSGGSDSGSDSDKEEDVKDDAGPDVLIPLLFEQFSLTELLGDLTTKRYPHVRRTDWKQFGFFNSFGRVTLISSEEDTILGRDVFRALTGTKANIADIEEFDEDHYYSYAGKYWASSSSSRRLPVLYYHANVAKKQDSIFAMGKSDTLLVVYDASKDSINEEFLQRVKDVVNYNDDHETAVLLKQCTAGLKSNSIILCPVSKDGSFNGSATFNGEEVFGRPVSQSRLNLSDPSSVKDLVEKAVAGITRPLKPTSAWDVPSHEI